MPSHQANLHSTVTIGRTGVAQRPMPKGTIPPCRHGRTCCGHPFTLAGSVGACGNPWMAATSAAMTIGGSAEMNASFSIGHSFGGLRFGALVRDEGGAQRRENGERPNKHTSLSLSQLVPFPQSPGALTMLPRAYPRDARLATRMRARRSRAVRACGPAGRRGDVGGAGLVRPLLNSSFPSGAGRETRPLSLSCPDLIRASIFLGRVRRSVREPVDGRNKCGHDDWGVRGDECELLYRALVRWASFRGAGAR